MEAAGGGYVTRGFRAGSLAFEILCSSAHLCHLVEELFQDLCCESASTLPLRFGLEEEVDEGRSVVRLVGASWNGPQAAPADVALDLLVGAVNQLALDAETGLLHLHAGVVARSEQCVLIAARSGTGKSLLTCELVKQGWGYLTDETAALSKDGRIVTGFPKPLTVKYSARRLVPDLVGVAVTLETSERTSWQIPATRVGQLSPEVLQPRLVVLLDRDRDHRSAAPSWTSLESADAAALLLQLALDGGRYGPGALRTVAELAQSCVTVRIEVGALESTAELVGSLFEMAPESVSVPTEWTPSSGQHGGVNKLCVPPSVVTVIVEGRAVVHNSSTRRVAALDEAGTEIWRMLHSGTPLPSRDAEAVSAMPFVQELRREGFVVDTAEEAQVR